MSAFVVVGCQWGDEGKGKIVDLLTERVDIAARYGGGPNAGHTIHARGRKFALHHIPSGILRDGVQCVIGNGVVLEPESLLREIDDLKTVGVNVERALSISDRAHVILPYHRGCDVAREDAANRGRIGTTRLGVGPTYETKAARTGLRVADLIDERSLPDKIRRVAEAARAAWGSRLPADLNPDPGEASERLLASARALAPMIADTSRLLNERLDAGAVVLCEGAQGTMLDLDHGTYPYVTSSSSAAGGACTGLGISPIRIEGVIGVMKAYSTRVGEGPFPTEQDNDSGALLRERGHEYGSTTGRPRRCGWFDAVAARYSVVLNQVECIALTLFDVLAGFDEIPVCVGYRAGGRRLDSPPPDVAMLGDCEPEYETLPGWKSEIGTVTRYEDLPREARAYVERIESLVGCEVGLISVSPLREGTILRPQARIAHWLPARRGA